MRILTRNHHTPYLWLLALAMPEHEWLALPSAHAPTGWRADQRPQPPNVRAVPHGWGAHDLQLLQSPADLEDEPVNDSRRAAYVAHNLQKFDVDVFELKRRNLPLIATSQKKASSFLEAGYHGDLQVVEPALPPGELLPWYGGGGYALTVANNLRRPLFLCEFWCELVTVLRTRLGLPTVLVGEGNEGLPFETGPAPNWERLKRYYRECAFYIDPIDPENENDFNLALMEAEGMGCPVLYLKGEGPEHMSMSYLSGRVSLLMEQTLLWPVERTRHEYRERYPSFELFAERWRRTLEELTR